jgi:methyltransferase (TIGR00027 family)
VITGGTATKIASICEHPNPAQRSRGAEAPKKSAATEAVTVTTGAGALTSANAIRSPSTDRSKLGVRENPEEQRSHPHSTPLSETHALPNATHGSAAAVAPGEKGTQHRSDELKIPQTPPPIPESNSATQLLIHATHPLYSMVRSSQLIAAARALELECYGDQALFRDIFAERLAGARLMAAQRERARTSTTDQLSRIPVRTRYFDDFLLRCLYGKEQGASSNEPPPRQVVILGAGLDMRAYRLKIPRDTVVYELDLAVVLEYKLRILRQEFPNHKPKALVKYVPSDLTKHWKQDLLAAGFDPKESSVWLLEGLTYYLPEPVCRSLFSDMRSLMPAGRASWVGASFVKDALVRKLQAQASLMPRTSEDSSEETFQSEELTPCPSLGRDGSRKNTPRRSSSQKQTFVFGTDDPEKFLKPLGFYTTAIVYLGEKGANYGRFARAFRHTMYVTAFAG